MNTVSVGASTCIYGLLAGLLGYMILNWYAMGRDEYSINYRNTIMCILCAIIGFIVFMSL